MMIFLPVSPASPCGPPITKRPDGLRWKMVLSSRSEPWASLVLPHFGKLGTKLCSQNMSKGHEFRSFICGITKHVTLVTSSNFFWFLGKMTMDSLGNIRALLLNVDKDFAVVSHATLLSGSCSRQASRMASETWSQSLSGCPSLTDSEVNKKVSISS
ncbi:hypothetical protein H5410_053638 [Solanum commersonii]|uniref:Uncharacterized protein n=1 Tax=Solanum commersonii TaxID=4109 RepID=A0A9J5X4F8_SOLCO|nr:hypothetical protein H5410_053638 [Solanum commersonii]